MTRFLLTLVATTEVVPFPIKPLAKSPEGLWNSILSTPLRAWVGTGLCRPYGTRFHFLRTYPGLTSWAIICRPTGGGSATEVALSKLPLIAAVKALRHPNSSRVFGNFHRARQSDCD
jgi:hypothetical protein